MTTQSSQLPEGSYMGTDSCGTVVVLRSFNAFLSFEGSLFTKSVQQCGVADAETRAETKIRMRKTVTVVTALFDLSDVDARRPRSMADYKTLARAVLEMAVPMVIWCNTPDLSAFLEGERASFNTLPNTKIVCVP